MKVLRVFYLVSILFAVLLVHLFKMQIVDYRHYKTLSERNRIRPIVIEAPRGAILDRNGIEIVSNRLAFDCLIIPQEGKLHLDETLRKLGGLLGEPEGKLEKRYAERKRGAFTPVLLADDISKERALRIEESTDGMPGVFIKTRPVREYRAGPAAAHATGYIGAMNPEEYKRLKNSGYRLADFIGKTGIEKHYEDKLKGRDGAVQYEADSRGRLLRVLSIQEPAEGKTLELAIDLELQKTLGRLLQDQVGTAIVMDLSDGGILGMVSSPSFDPNLFVKPARERGPLAKILTGAGRPLINRATAAEYPPGSTFKIVTASAGLESSKITTATRFFCPGFVQVGKRRFKCWEAAGHGSQDVIEALEHSCNAYFYNTALKLEIDDLAAEARQYGYGDKTHIDLPGERAGNVPSRDWKKRSMPKSPNWYAGETVMFAIGQGYMTATPLQVLRSAAVVATGGTLFEPRLVRKIDGKDVPAPKKKHVPIAAGDLAAMREGMRRVVQSPTGTAQRARQENVTIAGKTGTAQAGPGKANHAWFVGYAPSDKPEAAIVVLLEHGGRGGISAATIAGQAFGWMADQEYFK